MFNIFGSHKIGIIGDANSGKTVFLTSLLWNLEQRSLRLGKHSDMPTSVRIELPKNISPQHRFDYAGNKRQLQQHNQWPDKTVADYSLAKCSYDLPKYLRRKLTFVDIPGERLADVLVWECPNYAEWSERTLDQWRGSKDLSGYFNGFIKLLQCPNDNITPEVLSQSFKLGIRNTVFNYVPVVTPSTLFFDDGKMATWEEVNDNKWLGNRPIWKGGDFFPLPTEWKQSKGTQTGEIYRKCEANYRKYRKQVVLPIFAQIASCDSCIYCVDIFSILGSGGPAAFTSCSEEIKSFVHTLTQGNLHHLLRNWSISSTERCKAVLHG